MGALGREGRRMGSSSSESLWNGGEDGGSGGGTEMALLVHLSTSHIGRMSPCSAGRPYLSHIPSCSSDSDTTSSSEQSYMYTFEEPWYMAEDVEQTTRKERGKLQAESP